VGAKPASANACFWVNSSATPSKTPLDASAASLGIAARFPSADAEPSASTAPSRAASKHRSAGTSGLNSSMESRN
jgi:hypothetical protein